MGLHDGRMVVEVDDKTGKIIAFAMYKAAGIVVFRTDKAECLTQVARYSETAYPEIVVYLFFLERKDTHGYTAYLIMSGSYVLFVGRINFYYFSFFRITFHTCYGS